MREMMEPGQHVCEEHDIGNNVKNTLVHGQSTGMDREFKTILRKRLRERLEFE